MPCSDLWLSVTLIVGVTSCSRSGSTHKPDTSATANVGASPSAAMQSTSAAPRRAAPPVAALPDGMVRIPSGTLRSCAEHAEPPRACKEAAAVREFALDRTEVTVEDFERCVAASRCETRRYMDDLGLQLAQKGGEAPSPHELRDVRRRAALLRMERKAAPVRRRVGVRRENRGWPHVSLEDSRHAAPIGARARVLLAHHRHV